MVWMVSVLMLLSAIFMFLYFVKFEYKSTMTYHFLSPISKSQVSRCRCDDRAALLLHLSNFSLRSRDLSAYHSTNVKREGCSEEQLQSAQKL